MTPQSKRATAGTVTPQMDALAGASMSNLGQEMTMTSHITTPTMGAITLTLERSQLAPLDGKMLFDLLQVFLTLEAVTDGLLCQPRMGSEDNRLNPAGQLVGELSDWLCYAKRFVSDEVERRTNPTKKDAEWLGWARIAFEASYADDMAAFNVVVAEALNAKEAAHG